MKSFMSAAMQDTKPANGATECNTCDGGAVRTAGQESAEPAAPQDKPAPTEAPKDTPVVVMQGPLGSVITEALNKSLSKKAMAPVQIPGTAATESFAHNHVSANGQIKDASMFLSSISKAVGLVPATGEEPTTINTLLDCASKVDDIEFIMVGHVESEPSTSQVPQKSVMHLVNIDGVPANEEISIESVQVVVTYTKRPKG